MKGKILIVDDEAELRAMLKSILEDDYIVTQAEDGAALRKCFLLDAPDVILLDLKLPDANGLDLLPEIKKTWPDTEVIVLTGEATFEAAVQATMSGGTAPIFQSAHLQAVVRTIERVAPSDVTILITGESGSGKEVIADLLHCLRPRAKNRIIKINCAALPRDLIESELFGSKIGSYTGSLGAMGLFRQAEGGTLFLDEISEMPIDTQSKLLRVLQDQEVRPVGDTVSYKTNCRIIAATNRKPEEAIKDGKLREDLFYRISAISVYLPPLRERREDILPLANSFLRRFAAQANRTLNGFTPPAVERLVTFDWPGNVRQLQNEIQRAVLLSEGPDIQV